MVIAEENDSFETNAMDSFPDSPKNISSNTNTVKHEGNDSESNSSDFSNQTNTNKKCDDIDNKKLVQENATVGDSCFSDSNHASSFSSSSKQGSSEKEAKAGKDSETKTDEDNSEPNQTSEDSENNCDMEASSLNKQKTLRILSESANNTTVGDDTCSNSNDSCNFSNLSNQSSGKTRSQLDGVGEIKSETNGENIELNETPVDSEKNCASTVEASGSHMQRTPQILSSSSEGFRNFNVGDVINSTAFGNIKIVSVESLNRDISLTHLLASNKYPAAESNEYPAVTQNEVTSNDPSEYIEILSDDEEQLSSPVQARFTESPESLDTTKLDAEDIVFSLLQFRFYKRSDEEKMKILKLPLPRPYLKHCNPIHIKNNVYDNRYVMKTCTDWLVGSTKLNTFFCWYCLLFGENNRSVWNTTGYRDVKDIYRPAANHKKSRDHQICAIYFNENIKALEPPVDHQNERRLKMMYNCKIRQNRKLFKVFLDTLLFVINNLQRIKLDLINQLAIEILKPEVDLSNIFQNEVFFRTLTESQVYEVLECLKEEMLLHIDSEISKTSFFTCFIDDILDLTGLSKYAVSARFVNTEGYLQERFVGFYNISNNCCEDSFYNLIFRVFDTYSVNTYTQKLIAYSIDGSCLELHKLMNKMSSLESEPQLATCTSRPLTIIIEQCCRVIPSVRLFFSDLRSMFKLFELLGSSHRVVLTVMGHINLPVLNSVGACKSIDLGFIITHKQLLIRLLREILKLGTTNSEINLYANLGLKKLEDTEFILFLHIFKDIFKQLENLEQDLKKSFKGMNHNATLQSIEKLTDTLMEWKEEKKVDKYITLMKGVPEKQDSVEEKQRRLNNHEKRRKKKAIPWNKMNDKFNQNLGENSHKVLNLPNDEHEINSIYGSDGKNHADETSGDKDTSTANLSESIAETQESIAKIKEKQSRLNNNKRMVKKEANSWNVINIDEKTNRNLDENAAAAQLLLNDNQNHEEMHFYGFSGNDDSGQTPDDEATPTVKKEHQQIIPKTEPPDVSFHISDSDDVFSEDEEAPQSKRQKLDMSLDLQSFEDLIDSKYRDLYGEILDKIWKQLKVRFLKFQDMKFLQLADTSLYPTYSKNFPSEMFNYLFDRCKKFELKNEELLHSEFQVVCSVQHRALHRDNLKKTLKVLSDNNGQTLLPEYYKALCFMATYPLSHENQNFTGYHRIRKYLKNCRIEHVSTALPWIVIESDVLRELRKTEHFYDNVMRKFGAKGYIPLNFV